MAILHRRKKKSNAIKLVITGIILFIAIALGGIRTGINVLLIYYIISTYSEEFIKISISNSLHNQNPNIDLIFVSILFGLTFAIMETLIYLIFANEISIALSISRGFFTALVHIVSTGLIAYVLLKANKIKFKSLQFLGALLIGFGLHMLYNISIEYNITLLSIAIIIGCYFILSFLLFNSDTIYAKQQKGKNSHIENHRD